MTLIVKHDDLNRAKTNQQAKYLGQWPFCSKLLLSVHSGIHTSDR